MEFNLNWALDGGVIFCKEKRLFGNRRDELVKILDVSDDTVVLVDLTMDDKSLCVFTNPIDYLDDKYVRMATKNECDRAGIRFQPNFAEELDELRKDKDLLEFMLPKSGQKYSGGVYVMRIDPRDRGGREVYVAVNTFSYNRYEASSPREAVFKAMKGGE